MSDITTFDWAPETSVQCDRTLRENWSLRRTLFFCLISCGTFWAFAAYGVSQFF